MIEIEKMEEVEVAFLKVGTLLSGIIYDSAGNMLWPARMPISDEFLSKIKIKGIEKVYYTPPKFKALTNKDPMFITDTLDFAKYAIGEMAQQINEGRQPDTNLARVAINKIFLEMQGHMTGFLNLMVLREFDAYTYFHSINVGILSMFLTKKIGFNNLFSEQAGFGGFLHDIGKIKISSEIVNKKTLLTPSEYQIIKSHPVLGFNLIKDDRSISSYEKKMILFHH